MLQTYKFAFFYAILQKFVIFLKLNFRRPNPFPCCRKPLPDDHDFSYKSKSELYLKNEFNMHKKFCFIVCRRANSAKPSPETSRDEFKEPTLTKRK